MLNTRHSKAGFLGSLLFHLGLLMICFFSSIGYTYVKPPTGIEIEFIPYKEFDQVDNASQQKDNKTSNSSKINNDNQITESILQDSESVLIPNDMDTITLTEEVQKDESVSISAELENALSKIRDFEYNDTNAVVDENDNDIELSTNNSDIVKPSEDGYTLSDNRFAIIKVKPKYKCEEFGKVIVRVWVNQEGVTIRAEAGVRGTTESSQCLLREAKNAAMRTTWTPYFNAPEIQIGHITYNFHKY